MKRSAPGLPENCSRDIATGDEINGPLYYTSLMFKEIFFPAPAGFWHPQYVLGVLGGIDNMLEDNFLYPKDSGET